MEKLPHPSAYKAHKGLRFMQNFFVVFAFFLLIGTTHAQHQCEFQNGNPSGTLTQVCFHKFNTVTDAYHTLACLMCQITGMQIKCGGLMATINAAGYGNYDMISWPGMMCHNPVTLPIILESFTYNESGYFQWNTLSELNNDFFTIEKSYDLKAWEEIALVRSEVNTSASATSYTFRYDHNESQSTYYRLTQVDFDGTQVAFDPISVAPYKNIEVHIYPNPSSIGTITVDTKKEIVHYSIWNYSGQEVQAAPFPVSKEIDLTAVETGFYHLNLYHKSGRTSTVKIAKL